MDTIVPASTSGEQIVLHPSSNATEPRTWLRIQGGESIDPRDPKGLATLPLTDATELNAVQSRVLAAALVTAAEEMERNAVEHAGAYLGTDWADLLDD